MNRTAFDLNHYILGKVNVQYFRANDKGSLIKGSMKLENVGRFLDDLSEFSDDIKSLKVRQNCKKKIYEISYRSSLAHLHKVEVSLE